MLFLSFFLNSQRQEECCFTISAVSLRAAPAPGLAFVPGSLLFPERCIPTCRTPHFIVNPTPPQHFFERLVVSPPNAACALLEHTFPNFVCSRKKKKKGRFTGRSFCLRKGTNEQIMLRPTRLAGEYTLQQTSDLGKGHWQPLVYGARIPVAWSPLRSTTSNCGMPNSFIGSPLNTPEIRSIPRRIAENKSALSRRGKPGLDYEQLVNQRFPETLI